MRLRFFLSSPGDVADERTFAQQVIEQELPKDPFMRGRVGCEAVRWDDPAAPVAMPATLTPQEAVNRGLPRPSACDCVIVVLWSRLGTPLPASCTRPDGSRYLSGTEWEYEDAIAARPQPHILVYRRRSPPELGDPLDADYDERLAQYRRANDFFKRFRNADGSLAGGFAEYDTPQEFRDRLRVDLRAFIQRRLDSEQANGQTVRVNAPPPYGRIAKALASGSAVPIIGPGICRSGRPGDEPWDPDAPRFLPSGNELSACLADEAGFPSQAERDQLAEVASYYEAFKTRDALRERLRSLLAPAAPDKLAVPPLYSLLASLEKPLLIITTNYDTLIEQVFRNAQRPYDLVVYSELKELGNAVLWWPHGALKPETVAPNELSIELEKKTVIFKMHGSIVPQTSDLDTFVITESDYVELLARIASRSAIPALFASHCQDRNLLFLGYSLRDWSFRTILQSLNRFFAKRLVAGDDEIQSWAIDDRFSELELKFWQRRGVYPYEVNLDEFVRLLRARMSP